MDPNNPLLSFMPLVLIMVVFYFLILRPQQKRDKERKAKIESMAKGDEVVTNGGIYGKIVEISDTTVLMQVDTNTKIRVDKNAIQSVGK